MKKRILSTLLAISMAIVGVAASPSAVNVVHAEDLSKNIKFEKEYIIEENTSTQYFIIAKNTSNKTLDATIYATALDKNGSEIAVDDNKIEAIAPGATVAFQLYMETTDHVYDFETTINCKESEEKPVMQDIDVTSKKVKDNVIISATNNTNKDLSYVDMVCIFIKDKKAVDYRSVRFSDIQAGQKLSEQAKSYKCKDDFDSAEVYMQYTS